MVHRGTVKLKPLVSLLCIITAVSGGNAWAQDERIEGKTSRGEIPAYAQRDFREVVRKAKKRVFPAVVFINAVKESHRSGEKKAKEVSASGVLISPEGELLTNWHVVEKAVEVRCLLYDGRHFNAEIVGLDKDLDIALLRLILPAKTPPLPHAKLAEALQLEEGDFVMAMGAPWGMARSVSIGIVSCTDRYLENHSEYSLWLQTDASINPGNSGGPLVDTRGRVVGLTTMGSMLGGDMGFALPSDIIRKILPRLRQHGDVLWSWTGLQLQAIRDFDRNVYFEGTEGVLVAGADPGSPAKRAGIRERDRILSIDGKRVDGLTEEDLPNIRRLVGLLPINKKARIKLIRNKKKMTVELIPRRKGKVEGEELDCPRWDMTFKAINQFDNPDLFFYRKKGVFIFGMKFPGNASRTGFRRGDIVLEIDSSKVTDLNDVKRVHKRSLAGVKKKPRIMFKILRNGLTRQFILDFSRDYERE